MQSSKYLPLRKKQVKVSRTLRGLVVDIYVSLVTKKNQEHTSSRFLQKDNFFFENLKSFRFTLSSLLVCVINTPYTA